MAVPKLRFKEFYSDWNKLALDSIVKPNVIEVDKPTEDYTRLGIRSHCKGTFHQLVKIEDVLEADRMFTVPKDNLIVNITFAWEQAIAITDENDEGKLVSGRFPTFAFKNGHLPQFYKFILPNKRLKYDLGLASPGGAGRNKVLNKKEFLKIKIGTTDIKEQQKIADFLTTFDKRITAQQNIIADMEEIKKGLLQKIFSQEIRFKDDNGEDYPAWKDKLLGEICNIFKGASLSKSDISEDGAPFILYGELYTTYSEVAYDIVRKTDRIVDEKYFSKIGDVVVPTSGESAEEISTATCIMVKDVILAGDLNIIRSDVIDGRILSYILNHEKKHDLARVAQGASVVHSKADDIKKLKIGIPCLEEQNKIASFLSTYDKKIEAEKKILADLQEMKKGLLQRMFV